MLFGNHESLYDKFDGNNFNVDGHKKMLFFGFANIENSCYCNVEGEANKAKLLALKASKYMQNMYATITLGVD